MHQWLEISALIPGHASISGPRRQSSAGRRVDIVGDIGWRRTWEVDNTPVRHYNWAIHFIRKERIEYHGRRNAGD